MVSFYPLLHHYCTSHFTWVVLTQHISVLLYTVNKKWGKLQLFPVPVAFGYFSCCSDQITDKKQLNLLTVQKNAVHRGREGVVPARKQRAEGGTQPGSPFPFYSAWDPGPLEGDTHIHGRSSKEVRPLGKLLCRYVLGDQKQSNQQWRLATLDKQALCLPVFLLPQDGVVSLSCLSQKSPTHFCHASLLLKLCLFFSPPKMLYFAFILRVKNSGFAGFPPLYQHLSCIPLLSGLHSFASLHSTCLSSLVVFRDFCQWEHRGVLKASEHLLQCLIYYWSAPVGILFIILFL